jgi:cell division protein FtsB
MQLQEVQSNNSLVTSNDVEIQCSLNEEIENPNETNNNEIINQLNDENEHLKTEVYILNDKNEQLTTETNILNDKNEHLKTETNVLNDKNEKLKTETNILKEEINNLNFQLSSISMQRTTAKDVSKRVFIDHVL